MICTLLLATSLASLPIALESDVVDFDGKTLKMEGNVAIDYDGTRLTCKQMAAERGLGEKQALIVLKQEVELALSEGGTLYCGRAEVDTGTGRCILTGGDGVMFAQIQKDGTPLVVQSRRMRVQLDQAGKYQRGGVKEVVADRNVIVEWGDEYGALADQMTYRHGSSGGALISLAPRGVGGTCLVRSARGHVINARQIYADQQAKQVLFDRPVGKLQLAQEKDAYPVTFQSGTLAWDQASHVLTLRDDITIDQPGFGTITSTEMVKFWQKADVDTPYNVEGITSHGKTVLVYRDADGTEHQLACHGEASVDPINKVIRFLSPHGYSGNIAQQVHFCDDMGELYSDSVELSYTECAGKIIPQQLTIAGHVRIVNRSEIGPGDEGKVLQYAIADQLTYQHVDATMRLDCEGEKRVLFYDRINRVQISAPAVNIKRDGSGKMSYEGEGDVRFTLADKEVAQLRENFAQQIEERL